MRGPLSLTVLLLDSHVSKTPHSKILPSKIYLRVPSDGILPGQEKRVFRETIRERPENKGVSNGRTFSSVRLVCCTHMRACLCVCLCVCAFVRARGNGLLIDDTSFHEKEQFLQLPVLKMRPFLRNAA